MAMSVRTARQIAGSLSHPSKMPGHGYGLPAAACKIGQSLAKVPGTVCAICYAEKGMYTFPVVRAAQEYRLQSITHREWVQAMVTLIGSRAAAHARRWEKASPAERRRMRKHYCFRWHDSGDIQDIAHLMAIVSVCEQLPDVRFWLPTRERGLVWRYLRHTTAFPENLVVRLSAAKVDGRAETFACLPTSGVHTDPATVSGHVCPAPRQGGECKTCRACWDRKIQHVSYHAH